MSNLQKYPCIENTNGEASKEYIGILFNGDQGVYRKETIKFLKKLRASKDLISAVKAADGDLTISKILIEAEQFDVLVNVFNGTDSRTVILDYLDELYQGAVKETEITLSCMEEEFSNTVSQLGKNSDINDTIAVIDKSIEEQTEVVCKKLEYIHNKTAKSVIEKYHEACKRKLKKLKEEIQKIQDEKKRLEAIIQKNS